MGSGEWISSIRHSPFAIRLITIFLRSNGFQVRPLLARDQFLDFAQLLLAEKHFLADEEGR